MIIAFATVRKLCMTDIGRRLEPNDKRNRLNMGVPGGKRGSTMNHARRNYDFARDKEPVSGQDERKIAFRCWEERKSSLVN